MNIIAKNILSGDTVSFSIFKGVVCKIKRILPDPGIDFLCPGGFCDTQVNGFLGMDYSDPSLTEDMVVSISKKLEETGTFHHFPTIITRPRNIILNNIKTIVSAVKSNPIARDSICGIHLEGPFISADDGPRGAHDLKSVREPNIREFDEWLLESHGLLKVITVAPEINGAIELIKHAVKRGVVCSIGHSGATKEQIDAAVDAGARMSTHLGNGVYSKLERFDNPVFSQLANAKLGVSLIADGVHVGPALLKIVSLCKRPDQIILVSDLAPIAGIQKKTKMKWGGMNVEIAEDGSVRLTGTPYLAGAGSSLLRDVLNFSKFAGINLSESAKMATINPMRFYKLNPDLFEFKEGAKANFVLFSSRGLKKVWR